MEVYRLDIERAREFVRAAFPAMALANVDSISRPLALAIQASRREQMELDAKTICPLCEGGARSVATAPVRDLETGEWIHTATAPETEFLCHASEIREVFTMRQAAEDLAK